MQILLTPLFLIVFSICFPIESMGRELSRLRDKAKDLVKIQRPDWKLVSTREDDKETRYSWKSGRQGVSILIFYGNSRTEAKERMDFTSNRLSIGPGKPRKDLGDEAYFWKDENSGSMSIRFRKGRVYIDLAASSDEIAEDLAQELLKTIAKK